MSAENKTIVRKINAAFETNDVETFLSHCVDDVVWTMVGGAPLRGKDAIRSFMGGGPSQPPTFSVDSIVAEGDLVICVGDMTMEEGGSVTPYSYCDVWRLRDGKVVELRAFVIRTSRA